MFVLNLCSCIKEYKYLLQFCKSAVHFNFLRVLNVPTPRQNQIVNRDWCEKIQAAYEIEDDDNEDTDIDVRIGANIYILF